MAALLGLALLAGTAQAQGPGAGTIRIITPTNNGTVNGPVTLQVEIGGVTVRAAAEGDPAAFHYHALVDVDPAAVIQAGQPLPTGQENIIHTADRTLTLGNLAPGQHTVTVILTRTDHVPLTPPVQDRVTFTVGGAAPPAAAQPAQPAQSAGPVAAPRTGSGGMALLADQRVSPLLALLLAAFASLSLGGLAVGARVRR
jgi:hypothetical protein